MDPQDWESQVKSKRLFFLAYLFGEEVIFSEKKEKNILQIFKCLGYFINPFHTST